jgi:hypothetical protein
MCQILAKFPLIKVRTNSFSCFPFVWSQMVIRIYSNVSHLSANRPKRSTSPYTITEKRVKFLRKSYTKSGRSQAQSMMVMVMTMMMTTTLIIHRLPNFDSRTVTYLESKTEQDRKPTSVFGVLSLRENPNVSLRKMQHKGVISCIILWSNINDFSCHLSEVYYSFVHYRCPVYIRHGWQVVRLGKKKIVFNLWSQICREYTARKTKM